MKNNPVCGVCGVPATRMTQDLIPIQSDNEWMTFRGENIRYGCDNHSPESSKYIDEQGHILGSYLFQLPRKYKVRKSFREQLGIKE